MNRPIKFRAWDGTHMREPFDPREGDEYPCGGGITWQQFTGLTDKNGKEIYEGDCMVMDGDRDRVYEVFYHDGKGAFDCARVHYHNSACGGYVPRLNSNRLEIIGNIYENPELLTK